MPGGDDPDNRRDFPGGWIGDPQNGFTAAGRTVDQEEMFAYVRTLLHVRAEHEALRGGSLWHLFSDDASYVFLRETEDERILVVFNNSPQPREIRIPVRDTPAQGAGGVSVLFGEARGSAAPGEIRLNMPAQSISIFELN